MNAARTISLLAAAALAVALGLALYTPFWGNGWLSLTDRDYIVPTESGWLRFRATEMNPGSGGWWRYGEDGERHYHFTGTGQPPWRSISRAAAQGCPGFQPRNVATWCP